MLHVVRSGRLVIGKRALCYMLNVEYNNDIVAVFRRITDQQLSQVGFCDVKMKVAGTRRDMEHCFYATEDSHYAHISPDGSYEAFNFDEALNVVMPLANLLVATKEQVVADRALRQERRSKRLCSSSSST